MESRSIECRPVRAAKAARPRLGRFGPCRDGSQRCTGGESPAGDVALDGAGGHPKQGGDFLDGEEWIGLSVTNMPVRHVEERTHGAGMRQLWTRRQYLAYRDGGLGSQPCPI